MVLLTLFFAIYNLKPRIKIHRYVLLILWICFSTELVNSIFTYLGISIRIPYLISFILHHSIWLYLLRENVEYKKGITFFIGLFWIFALVNTVYVQWSDQFNYYTFIAGTSVYLTFFIIESYRQLNKENITFFISNNYILLFTPLLFFYGLSLMFGFKASSIRAYIVYGDLSLYGFIINISCVAYYLLLNIYIYRESKLDSNG